MNDLRKEYHNKTAGQIGEKARDLQTSYFTDEYVFWLEEKLKALTIPVVSFELPSDDIFDIPEVNLNNPLEEFYYYERPPYLKSDQKDFKERLQKALNYLKGN